MASRKESGSVSGAVMASTGGTLDSPVKQIQIEGLVSLTTVLFWEKMSSAADKGLRDF